MPIGLTTFVSTTFKTWYTRATRSRMTVAFMLSMLASFAMQTALHSMVLLYYSQKRGLVTSVIDAAGVQRGFTIIQNGVLEICSGIQIVHGTACRTVYNTSAAPTLADTSGIQCAEGLTWLENYLINSKSEEVLYLVLEVWLLIVSLIALMNESIPHLIVVLAAQLINTGWISYRIARDVSVNQTYNEMVVDRTCVGFDILEGWWQHDMFYVTLGCSIAALLGISPLITELIKLYSKAKLSSVGSPPVMNRMLRWRLWMLVLLQFATFFIIASAAIWYDKRKSVAVASHYSTGILYDAGFYVVAIIILPWFVLGSRSISKENRFQFLIYAVLSIILLVVSGLWFGSALFRYEYWDWRTFSCATTMADALLVITCTLSVICRLNFGKGLAHFLVVEQNLQASGFAHDTFLNDLSNPQRPGVGNKQAIASNRSGSPLSQPNLGRSRSSLHASSVYSIKTAVFVSWLSSTSGQDPERRRP